jgi:hypothetical protein
VNIGERFLEILERLLARQSVGPDAARDMSAVFEIVADRLLGQLPARKDSYFDGVVFETSQRKTSRKVEFTGEIWVGRGKEQWKERFAATVIDKRITKQGFWLRLRVGTDGSTDTAAVDP